MWYTSQQFGILKQARDVFLLQEFKGKINCPNLINSPNQGRGDPLTIQKFHRCRNRFINPSHCLTTFIRVGLVRTGTNFPFACPPNSDFNAHWSYAFSSMFISTGLIAYWLDSDLSREKVRNWKLRMHSSTILNSLF